MKLTIAFLFFFECAYAQIDFSKEWAAIEHEYVDGNDSVKEISSFLLEDYDFSSILQYDYPSYDQQLSLPMNGIFGIRNEKIEIFFSEVNRSKNPREYEVKGKSNLKGTICNFSGKITLNKAVIYNKNKEVEYQRIVVIGTYNLKEDRSQKGSGIFKGGLKLVLFPTQRMDSQKISFNLGADVEEGAIKGFVGTWKGYGKENLKKCIFGFYRFPYEYAPHFDLGAGEQVIHLKYAKTWFDYSEKEWEAIYHRVRKDKDLDSIPNKDPYIYLFYDKYGIHTGEPTFRKKGKDKWYLKK
ncbi:hypothetical protein [Aquimarina sp. MMG016]|uniref:hypothetical protein n=1 Tax=Aquimarina sp. MMG016 TaxID=2822690 RepID=UPI001B39EA66|nr:hypothetical protein [Aquimarina sp. MMG016]MBQ4819629.1 hypothetical protein [Aquimarina sp. MMG016]